MSYLFKNNYLICMSFTHNFAHKIYASSNLKTKMIFNTIL